MIEVQSIVTVELFKIKHQVTLAVSFGYGP